MIKIAIHKKLNAPFGSMNLKFDAELASFEFLGLYGPSGVGKTSILRMLSGLMNPDRGSIIVDGEIWFDSEKNVNLSPQKRNIGIVFQDYGLFPNMTVLENLRYALQKNQSDNIITEMVEVIELGDLITRYPRSLSGGQKQRVALARALIRKPKLLLLDEPLSALDHEMRQKMQDYILNLHRTFKLNTILVSHQLSEVIKMSDHIIMMSNGKISKRGGPSEIFGSVNHGAQLQLKATVVEVKLEKDHPIAVVLIGDQLVDIKLTKGNTPPTKGSKIMLNKDDLY